MGWRFRKSIPIGKVFRINLSRRGIGASAGIPGSGLRYAIGPAAGAPGTAGAARVGFLGCVGGLIMLSVKGFLLILVLSACFGIYSVVSHGGGRRPLEPGVPQVVEVTKSRASTVPSPSRPVPALSPFPAGSRVTLARPGGAGHAHVSTDRQAFEQNLTASFGTFRRLSEEGRVLRIANGTTALVTGVDGDSREVRLLDGDKSGSEGWVEARYLSPAGDGIVEGAREADGRRNEAARARAALEAEKSARDEQARAKALSMPALPGHEPGDRLVVMDTEGRRVLACLDERTFRMLKASKGLDAALEKAKDKLVVFEPYSPDRPIVQGVEVLANVSADLAKVRILTGPDRGKTVYLAPRFLLTPLESARAIGDLEAKLAAKRADGGRAGEVEPRAAAKSNKGAAADPAPVGSRVEVTSVTMFADRGRLAAYRTLGRRPPGLSNGTDIFGVAIGSPAVVLARIGGDVQVRIESGSWSGREGWLDVGGIRPAPTPVAGPRAGPKATRDTAREAAAAKAIANRPVSLLAMARNFERDVNTKAALEAYRKLVADFPGTPQAREASGRIKVLTGM